MVDQVSGKAYAGPLRPTELRPQPAATAGVSAPSLAEQGLRARSTGAGEASRFELRGLVRDMAAAPPVDSGRVDQLRTALAGGLYRLDPVRLADAMLASEARGRG
jgi:flagellar biosynthesis anti-sigma factor FlgM